MNFYERAVLPPILDWVMRKRLLHRFRRALVGGAAGRVLEVGVGSGLNFAYYPRGVSVVGIDPSPHLLARARRRAAAAGLDAEVVKASATALPFADKSFDTVVMTWTLCSIPDPAAALAEMRRVLIPGGELLFVEHGHAPESNIARWQKRLTPVWRRVSGGCHLDRKPDELVRAAEFDLVRLDNEYAEGPRPFTYMYIGRARRPAG